MEATKEGAGLLDKILPPRLEDAGLEDCALPPDSIREAFLKAASAVKSRAGALLDGSNDDAEGGCITDPWPATKEEDRDVLIGVSPPSAGAADTVDISAPPDAGPCVAEKGVGDLKDKVVIGGGAGKGTEGEGGCGGVPGGGLEGLGAEEKRGREEEDDDEERPTLVEGVV